MIPSKIDFLPIQNILQAEIDFSFVIVSEFARTMLQQNLHPFYPTILVTSEALHSW